MSTNLCANGFQCPATLNILPPAYQPAAVDSFKEHNEASGSCSQGKAFGVWNSALNRMPNQKGNTPTTEYMTCAIDGPTAIQQVQNSQSTLSNAPTSACFPDTPYYQAICQYGANSALVAGFYYGQLLQK